MRQLNGRGKAMAKKRNVSSPGGGKSGASGDSRQRNGGGQRPGFSNVQLVFMFGLLLVVNYYGMMWFKKWSGQDDGGTNSAMYQVAGSVTVRELSSPNTRFTDECKKGGTPVVLRNSVVEKWPARRKWTPKYMQSKITHINGVYQNDNRWFGPYYDSQKPLTYLCKRSNDYNTNVSMSGKKFFTKLRHPSEGEFLYFTGDIDQLGEWSIDDIQPLSELLSLNPKRSSVNAWMGQPHVIAHCHYDGYHNFYAQLYGTKKFTLFQPINWPGLYPYPFLHPSHAQTQVNLSDPKDLEYFPLVGKVRALEVVLQPGDLLYMPPLWFHLVESMELSISVNVWTDSEQTSLMEEVFSVPLPTESVRWNSTQQKSIATSLLVHSLLSEVCRRRMCRHVDNDPFLDNQNLKSLEGEFYFVYQLWTTRYRMLMERGELPDGVHGTPDEAVLCEHMSKDDSKVERQVVTMLLEELGLHGFVQKVATNIELLPEDTWELWTGNYVEYLTTTAVEVQLVGMFLRHYGSCFF